MFKGTSKGQGTRRKMLTKISLLEAIGLLHLVDQTQGNRFYYDQTT
jgi:hypothetical protein